MIQKHPREMPVRIIPLGGVEEIGRNMTVIEYGNDIVVIDAGLEFPQEETPGIDYIIPNTKYLEARKHKIRGLIISHGHLDHVGAIPYLIERLGLPPIYTTKLTKAMILKRQEEFPHSRRLHIEEIKSDSMIKLGQLKARFFDITHTIPDAIGTILETPFGNVIYPGDFKIELDVKGKPMHIDQYTKLGKEKNLVLLMESTNAEAPGFSIPEKTVHQNLEKIIAGAKGRVITGTFSSLLERIIEIIKIAERHGRKVVIDGFSMKANVEIAKELGFFKPKKDTIITADRISSYPPEKIVAICTGAQGEENAALMRIANRKHKYIRIQKDDAIILSSSIIPGNERNIQNLKDNLARQGAKIIHYKVADVHASGHAYQEELKLMLKMLRPKFLIPIHGYYFMLKTNADLAESVGISKENIAIPLNNGSIIEVTKEKIHLLKESVPANLVMVDGLGVGDVQEVVMRDRQALAQDGIFVVITIIDSQTGKVRNSPDIISRGFVYLRESQELLRQVRHLIRKTVEDATAKMHPINMDYVKNLLRENIGKFLFQKTKRRPMVLTVLIEV
ncbi:MAG: ribonuclease J [Candidatus Terrybacteria bacterium]|nr:ribonuclease J [Candidatus Terrybacteria bacterium]